MSVNNLRASYLVGNSILHRTDARIKVAFMLTFLVVIALLPTGAWAVYLLMAGFLIMALLLSDLPKRKLLKRSLLMEVPILFVVLPQIFMNKVDCYEIVLFMDWKICISMSALVKTISLLLKSWLSVQVVVLMASVTRFEDMLSALYALGLPRLLAAILGLMWRYLFIMIDEVQRMQRARASRSACLNDSNERPAGSLLWRASVTGNMAGTLMLRSLQRGDRVYQAMLARGYDGDIRNVDEQSRLLVWQYLLIIAVFLMGFLMVLLAYGINANA